ncbi:MAG: hypothetical protein ACR2MG_16105 [Pyrinomonadaceae bacterium]
MSSEVNFSIGARASCPQWAQLERGHLARNERENAKTPAKDRIIFCINRSRRFGGGGGQDARAPGLFGKIFALIFFQSFIRII